MAFDRRITPRDTDYSQWYNDVIRAADFVDDSPTKGAMVIKPNGYALWERIQSVLDKEIKVTGHKNAYFPLLVPKSLLQKESEHVAGFALESAVVTHHRLKEIDGELVADPESRLKDEYIIRPTSEAIIYDSFSRWIQSYRDLPLLINQWANVVRWEMRTRPFLRTSEFLWQEGHTAHETQEGAQAEQKKMLDVYHSFIRDYLAIEAVVGVKSESETFAGADTTFTLEAMMQDGKALQCCTSHDLGQNFSKAFEINFVNQEGESEKVWQTSWGISTRIIGAVIMSHGDDKGLVLPPMIAPVQVVFIVIGKSDEEVKMSSDVASELSAELESLGVRVLIDVDDSKSIGERIYKYEKEGVPLRLEIGPKDLEKKSVTIKSRISEEKNLIEIKKTSDFVVKSLDDIQKHLLKVSKDRLIDNTVIVESMDELEKAIATDKFALAYWDGTKESEAKVKSLTSATIRCLPFDLNPGSGSCIVSGKPTIKQALFAKAY